ncbi:hypothetical protein [Fibrisoma limi]|nr:hypothetical protein [Fibrisoma limi]
MNTSSFRTWFKQLKAEVVKVNPAFTAGCFDRLFRAYAYMDYSVRSLTPQQAAAQYAL